jgi:hypothetical protein
MKDIRIGNDISVRWSLYKGDEAYDLTNLPVTLYLKNAYGKKKVENYAVNGNQISWTFYGKDQKNTGKYSMVLVIREGEQGMASTDYCDFVQLVSCACQVSGADDENVQTETIELTSEVDFPPIIVDNTLSESSLNPIANKAVAEKFAEVEGKMALQPDWNQSDPISKDYIKNRTHGIVFHGDPRKSNYNDFLKSLTNPMILHVGGNTIATFHTGYHSLYDYDTFLFQLSWDSTTDNILDGIIPTNRSVSVSASASVVLTFKTIGSVTEDGEFVEHYQTIITFNDSEGWNVDEVISALCEQYCLLISEDFEIAKLDQRYIPETIARKSELLELSQETELLKEQLEENETLIEVLQNTKIDKVEGKGLSTNDFTNEDKIKVQMLENGELEKRVDLGEFSLFARWMMTGDEDEPTKLVSSGIEDSKGKLLAHIRGGEIVIPQELGDNLNLTTLTEYLGDRFDDLEVFIEDLQNTKIDKEADDYYPQLAVGLADNLSGVDVVDSEVNFRRSGGGAISDGVARIEAIKGNSVVWNQLVNLQSATGGEYSNGKFIITNATERNANIVSLKIAKSNANHKYLLIGVLSTSLETKIFAYSIGGSYPTFSSGEAKFITSNKNGEIYLYPFGAVGVVPAGATSTIDSFVIHDLTKMFGAGNEPTTIEEFYQRIPMGVDLNAYNEGEVIHMDVQSIESQGVNAWDEEWELGSIQYNNGVNLNSTNRIRTKNPIPIIGGSQYCITMGNKGASVGTLCYYDRDMIYISGEYPNSLIPFTTPTNAKYMKIGFYMDYGTTYNHDICINISDTSINGKYFPYIKRVEDLAVIRKYFHDGMKSAGTAHDEIRYNKESGKWEKVVSIGVVDLGTLRWQIENTEGSTDIRFFSQALDNIKTVPSGEQANILCAKYGSVRAVDTYKAIQGVAVKADSKISIYDASYADAASFTAAMSGVMLYYELETPIVTELDAEDQFKDLDYQVWNCGTEKAIAEGKSAPLAADITYGFNAIGKIKELESLVAALRAKVGI